MIHSMIDLPSISSYLSRIGAEPRSLRTAVVSERHGQYWTDTAVLYLDIKAGTFSGPEEYLPTADEVPAIMREVLTSQWPTHTILRGPYELPDTLKYSNWDNIYELRGLDGGLIMLQQRLTDRQSGEKRYVPWTYWSDDIWRPMEPEGKLPLYGLDKIGDYTTIFIHEGAKSARTIQRLIEGETGTKEAQEALARHPWGPELAGAAHIGWIGGALSPLRTDWSALAAVGIKRAYIVADNDFPGKSAIPKISQKLKGITTFSVEFNDTFPASFDLADDFPESMFKVISGVKNYVGPAFRDLLQPATWATDLVPVPGERKPKPVIRKEFSDLWVWVEEVNTFVCKEVPAIKRDELIFNGMASAFSHTRNTAALLREAYKGRTVKMSYRPDLPDRMITDKTSSAINLHSSTTIKSREGDWGPWEEFLTHLVPIERERRELMRWCATLIARPDIRMLYSLLLVSERQGMGKSTLGERILAPLVGHGNVGYPGERDIVESNFNGWATNKRLVVVGEIYTGQSFKAYNILKTYITDKTIDVNEKFQRPYTIDNWVHVVACSNSKKALRVEESDRRWFYPQLSETPWPLEKWTAFYGWIGSGGLGIIKYWAEQFGDYVDHGASAPMTPTKAVLIEESRGEVLNHWHGILDALEQDGVKVCLAMSEVIATLKTKHSGRFFETAHTLKKEAVRRGWVALAGREYRMTIDGSMSYVIASPVMASEFKEGMHTSRFKEAIGGNVRRLSSILQEGEM